MIIPFLSFFSDSFRGLNEHILLCRAMSFPVLHTDEIMHNVMLGKLQKIIWMFESPCVLYSHLNTA